MPKRPPKPTDRPASPRYKKRKEERRAGKAEEVTLRALLRQRPTKEEWDASWDEIRKQGPRSTGIVSAAFTEDALRYAILTKMTPELTDPQLNRLLEPPGPLSSFYQMIELGFALALYGDLLREDLHTIRTIRNGFAHALKPLTFETLQIAKEVGSLKYLAAIKKLGDDDPPGPGAPWTKFLRRGFMRSKSNREKFELTCLAAADDLFYSNPSGTLSRLLRMTPPLP